MEKIGCLIYHYGERYRDIARCAVDSFKKYHPDIEMYEVNDSNIHKYESRRAFPKIGAGVRKYVLANEVYRREKLDKIIVLGADTITCARLDEFIDGKGYDMYGTLDYYDNPAFPLRSPDGTIHIINCPVKYTNAGEEQTIIDQQMVVSADGEAVSDIMYLNADVVCFASMELLDLIPRIYFNYKDACFDTRTLIKQHRSYCIEASKDAVRKELVEQKIIPQSFMQMAFDEPEKSKIEETLNKEISSFHYLGEQGVINIINACSAEFGPLKYKINAIEFPYAESKFVYNVRAKETLGYSTKHLHKYYVQDNKLYTGDGKHLKVWHYGAGLGTMDESAFNNTIEEYNSCFSPSVKKFLNEECGCGDFFNE